MPLLADAMAILAFFAKLVLATAFQRTCAAGAFLRNLELGVLFMGGEIPSKLRRHFEYLIAEGTLLRWNL